MVWSYFDSWTSKLLTFETSTKLSLSFKGASGVSGERGDQGKPGRTVSLWSSDGKRFTGSTQMLDAFYHAKQNRTLASVWREFSGRNGRELKQRRRRRQRERQKSNRLRLAKQQLCTLKRAVPFSKFLVSKFFSLGSDKNFGGCIKRKVLVFFIYWSFFFLEKFGRSFQIHYRTPFFLG